MSLTARLRRQWAANRGWTTELQEPFSEPAARIPVPASSYGSLSGPRCARTSRWRRAGLRPSGSHLHAGMIGHFLHVLGGAGIARAPGTLCAHRLHVEGEPHLSRLFELERGRDPAAPLSRALESAVHPWVAPPRKPA